MIDIVLALTLWYGLGALAAAWAARKGHASDLWIIGAALWGALMVPLLIVARIAVLARPARPELPMRPASGAGSHVLLLVHVDDSPRESLAPIAGMTRQIASLVIVVLVSEEARGGVIATSEIDTAEVLLHRILRACPPVETSTAITSLSALDQLARQGWRADRVAATPQLLGRPSKRTIARAASQLGRSRQELVQPVDPRPAALGTQPPSGTSRRESADAS